MNRPILLTLCLAALCGLPATALAQGFVRPGIPDPRAGEKNAGKKDDRGRSFNPAYLPHVVHFPTPHVQPEPAELHLPPVEPSFKPLSVERSFKVPPVSEFHTPTGTGGIGAIGEAIGGVVAAIGAAIASAFRAIFGLPRAKDSEA